MLRMKTDQTASMRRQADLSPPRAHISEDSVIIVQQCAEQHTPG